MASSVYLDASRSNPNSEYIHNKLGITYSQLKYYREASDAFYRSIVLNPKYPFSYNNLGSVYFALDEKKRAEANFKKAISLNPNVASFHIKGTPPVPEEDVLLARSAGH